MRVGVQFPNEFLVDDMGGVREFVQAAEDLGYAHLLIYEHVLGAQHSGRTPPLEVPYDETTRFHEPMVLLGYLAAITSTIELATGVIVLPQRQTALVAKQTAEVALLSEGRLRLGVGVGHNYVEYDALGQSFRDRGARIEEQIEVLRLLWSEPLVDLDGKWHRIDRCGIAPRPEHEIPIWIGGFSEAAYRRAARIADGFVYSLMGTAGIETDPKGTVRRMREMVEENGRPQSDFGIDLLCPLPMTPGEFARVVEDWADTDITHITLHLGSAFASTAQCVSALEAHMAALR